MFYVRIDISKYKHDYTIIDEHNLVIIPPKTIKSSEEGFVEPSSLLPSLNYSQGIYLEWNQALSTIIISSRHLKKSI